MNYFNQLSLIQKVILISIAGVVSIIALVGLSETYQDYYVSAALARAFFWGILLLVLSSPFIYLARRKNNKGKAEKELEKAKSRTTRFIVHDFKIISFHKALRKSIGSRNIGKNKLKKKAAILCNYINILVHCEPDHAILY